MSLTPIASPTWCTATVTWMARSIATSCRSTWIRFSETGSNCMSRMMAMRASVVPSKVTLEQLGAALVAVDEAEARPCGSTATFTGLAPP